MSGGRRRPIASSGSSGSSRPRAPSAPQFTRRAHHDGPRRRRQGDADADRGPARARLRLAPRSRRWPTPARSRSAAPTLALTTDSFVVKPIRFPGGSIGELAVNGTVNDLAMAGARPLALTPVADPRGGPRRRRPARRGRGDRRAPPRRPACEIVAGDTKVVERGHADQMYLCTTGIGRRRPARGALARPACGPATGSSSRARSATTARRSCSPAASSSSTPTIESDTRSLWPAADALLDAAGPGAALHARRDARRRRLGAQRARARLGRGDGRARGRRAGATRPSPGRRRSSGSTRCTSPTRASSSPSSRPRRPTRRWPRCARSPGCERRGGDRRGEDGAARDGARGDGVRRQAGDGPARRRPAAADLLSRGRRTDGWQPSSYPTRHKTEADHRPRPLDDHRPVAARATRVAMTVGHEPEPRGHHHRARSPACRASSSTTRCSPYEVGAGVHAGLVRRRGRASSTRSC